MTESTNHDEAEAAARRAGEMETICRSETGPITGAPAHAEPLDQEERCEISLILDDFARTHGGWRRVRYLSFRALGFSKFDAEQSARTEEKR